jgi:signal transduction histidine kinase
MNARDALPPKALQLLDVARRNSERLVRLVGEVLDVEKIESGALSFDVGPVVVQDLLSQSIEANWAFAAQHEVSLKLGIVPGGTRVRGDFDRLMQVLTNLISNAIKFSDAGTPVEIAATRRKGSVRITVTDEGPGIPESFRPKVFEKFAQADSSVKRRKGGTGLGLSICKVIVERLGGTIGFDSEEGRGSTFYFDLPESPDDRVGGVEIGGGECQTAG